MKAGKVRIAGSPASDAGPESRAVGQGAVAVGQPRWTVLRPTVVVVMPVSAAPSACQSNDPRQWQKTWRVVRGSDPGSLTGGLDSAAAFRAAAVAAILGQHRRHAVALGCAWVISKPKPMLAGMRGARCGEAIGTHRSAQRSRLPWRPAQGCRTSGTHRTGGWLF